MYIPLVWPFSLKYRSFAKQMNTIYKSITIIKCSSKDGKKIFAVVTGHDYHAKIKTWEWKLCWVT